MGDSDIRWEVVVEKDKRPCCSLALFEGAKPSVERPSATSCLSVKKPR